MTAPGAAGSRLVCSLGEAQRRLGERPSDDSASAPGVARRLRAAGAASVCIVGLTGPEGRALHWIDTEHAQGWLASAECADQRVDSATFADHFVSAVRRGFVSADAAVLATMATSARGERANAAFVHDPVVLPQLSWGDDAHFSPAVPRARRRLDLYAIVDSAQRLQQVLDSGVGTVQLRIKTPPAPDRDWHAALRGEMQRSIAACAAAGAELFVNDHWQLAAELGASGVHLGQEDLVALGEAGRAALQAGGLALGVSSHSLWELCRARALAPRYIACGPVWPTLTKAMPWRPQGLDNLTWWCRMAGFPVVAIGGVLGAREVAEAARCGADGVCIVRGLGENPARVVPALQAALGKGREQTPPDVAWPHPSLDNGAGG